MSSTDWSDAKRARVDVAARPRRIIFNDDTHELALEDANTSEGFLAHRIAPLAGTQVGTLSWSVLCGQFDAPAYDSRVQPIYGDAHGGPVKYWQKVTENVKTLARDDRCPLRLVCDFAHEHAMEAFASVRMNDVHDSFMVFPMPRVRRLTGAPQASPAADGQLTFPPTSRCTPAAYRHLRGGRAMR